MGGLDYFLGAQPVKYQKEAISYFREIEKSKVGLNKFDIHFLHEDYQVVFYPIFCKNETIGFVYGNNTVSNAQKLLSFSSHLSRKLEGYFMKKKLEKLNLGLVLKT